MSQQVPTVTTDDFVNFAADKPEKKSRVINLSQYGPTYFGPEHAQVLKLKNETKPVPMLCHHIVQNQCTVGCC